MPRGTQSPREDLSLTHIPLKPNPDDTSSDTPDTLSAAIRKDLLGSCAERFSDVALIARDNARVPAVRALLAVRSAYFRARFFAGYADEAKKELTVPQVSSVALKEVVQYAYTDDCALLKKAAAAVKIAQLVAKEETGSVNPNWKGKKKNAAPQSTVKSADTVKIGMHASDIVNLVDLLMAADYFQMSSFAKRVSSTIVDLLHYVPSVTCVVMEAATRQRAVEMVAPQIMKAVRSVLRRAPQDCLLVEDFRRSLKRVKGVGFVNQNIQKRALIDSGVLMLRHDTLESILKDGDLFTSETYLFQVLYYWATDGLCLGSLRGKKPVVPDEKKEKNEGGSKDGEKEGNAKKRRTALGKRKAAELNVPTENATVKQEDSRWEHAKRMVKHIDLERLKPSFVRDYVEPSGLLDREGILAVYQQQALEAERGRALYDSFRGGSVWANGTKTWTEETNGGYYSRVLGSPWLRGGRHEWTFRLEKDSDCTWLGITSVDCNEKEFFGKLRTGWAFASQGTCTQAGRMQKRVGPCIRQGKTVKMILNLTRGGTMTMVVEGNEKSFRAFSDMSKTGAKQFKPVVYLKRPARISLIAERHTMD